MSDQKFSPFPSDDAVSSVGLPGRGRSRRWASIGVGLSLALILVLLTLMGLASFSRAAPLAAPVLPAVQIEGQISPPGEVVYGEPLTFTLRFQIPAGEDCADGLLQIHFEKPGAIGSYLLVNYVDSTGPLTDSLDTPLFAPVMPTVTHALSETESAWIDWGLGTISNTNGSSAKAYKILLTARVSSDSHERSSRSVRYDSGNSHHLRCGETWYVLNPSPPGVILAQPDLSLSKEADPSGGELSPDQMITYTLTMENDADARAAYDVVLSDTLPANATYEGAVEGTAPSVAGNTLTWTVGTLTPGQSVRYSFLAKVPASGNVLHAPFTNQTEASAWSITSTIPGARQYLPSDSYDHNVLNADVEKANTTAWNYPGPQGSTTGNALHEAVAGEDVTITVYFTVPQGTIAYSVNPRVLMEDGLDPTGADQAYTPEYNQGSIDPQKRTGKNFTQFTFTEIGTVDASASAQVLSYTIYAHPRQNRWLVGSTALNDGTRLLVQPILRWCDTPGCTVVQSDAQYYAENETDNSTVSVVFIRPDVEPEISHTYLDGSGLGQGGGAVRFDILNTNNRSRPDAYDLVLTATLEPGLTYSETFPVDDGHWVNSGRTYITWTVPVTLPEDTSWSAAITATLPTTFVVGSEFTTTAAIHHETFPGAKDDEGIYVGNVVYTILPGLNHVKYAWPDTNVTIGDTVYYTVVTGLAQGTALYSPFYTDTLALGFQYVFGSFDLQGASLIGAPIVVNDGSLENQQDLAWYMDDLDLLEATSSLFITATYQAELSGLNTQGEAVYASSESDIRSRKNADNRAIASWLTVQGVPTSVVSLEPAVHTVEVYQPFLRNSYFDTARTDGPYGDEEVGGEISFEITFRNSTAGNVAAHDVHVCDELPQGLAYESLYSFSAPPGCSANFISQPSPGDVETICWIIDEVCKSGADFSLEYTAIVLPDATPGLPRTNDARITDYSAQPGGVNDGDLDDDDLPMGVHFDRNYMYFPDIALPDNKQCPDTGSGECPFTVLGLRANKTAQQSTVGPGHLITYVIDYEDTSILYNYSSIVISDVYDANLSYVSATPLPSTNEPGQRLLVWNIASLLPGGNGQISLVMQVSPSLSGAGAVTNSINWSGWDGSQTVTPGPIEVSTPVNAANLHMRLDGPATTHAGDSIMYTVVYSNDGTSAASPMTITLDYGPYLTFDSATLQGSPISPEGGTDNVFVDNTPLPADSSPRTLALWLTVDAPLPYSLEQIDSSATVKSPTSLLVGDDVTMILERPQFDFSKTGPDLAPAIEGLLQYEFQLVNTGDYTATNCIITDTWDAATSFASGVDWNTNATYATYAIASLNPGATATVNDLFVTVDDESARYANVAELSCDQTTTIDILEETWAASIANSKTASADPAFPGRPLTYTIHYTNTGAAVVHAEILDTLPAGFDYQGPAVGAVSGEGCLTPGWQFQGVTGQDATWACATLVADATGELQIWGTVTTDLAYEGTYLINVTEGSGLDIPSRPIDQPLYTLIARPWLDIAKNAGDNDPVAPGDYLTYTLDYSNYGTAPAYDVIIEDQLPAQVTFMSCDPDCTHDSGHVTWDSSTAPALSTVLTDTMASTTLVVQVNLGTGGQTIVNEDYSIQSQLLYDPVSGPAVETPILTPHMSLVKTASPEIIPAVGASIVYTITYTNDGGGLLTNVVITDQLSSNVGVDSGTLPPQCEHAGGVVGGVVTCAIGDLSPEQSGAIKIDVESAFAQDVTNQAQGDSDQTEPVASNLVMLWYDADTCYEVQYASFSSNSPVPRDSGMQFTATYLPTIADTPVTYAWDFGGSGTGSGTDGPTPIFTYTVPGTYTVQLEVDNDCPQAAVQFQDDVNVGGTQPTIYLPLVLKVKVQ